MGKLVAEIGGNVRVVGVAHQRVEVVLAPGAHAEIAEVEQHHLQMLLLARLWRKCLEVSTRMFLLVVIPAPEALQDGIARVGTGVGLALPLIIAVAPSLAHHENRQDVRQAQGAAR